MKFEEIWWPDSRLLSTHIEYDKAVLRIECFTLDKKIFDVICTGFAGITNLCIWDDTAIFETDVKPVDDNSEFVRKMHNAYGKSDLSGRSLEGLLELKIQLSNYIEFSIYCLNIEVVEVIDPA